MDTDNKKTDTDLEDAEEASVDGESSFIPSFLSLSLTGNSCIVTSNAVPKLMYHGDDANEIDIGKASFVCCFCLWLNPELFHNISVVDTWSPPPLESLIVQGNRGRKRARSISEERNYSKITNMRQLKMRWVPSGSFIDLTADDDDNDHHKDKKCKNESGGKLLRYSPHSVVLA